MTKVAVLGAGLLGQAFAEGLLSRGGSDVSIWNRTRSKAERLTAFGAFVADTVAEAVRDADRVHIVLLDDDTVDVVTDELKGKLRAGTVVVDHTTTRPDRTAARMLSLEQAGVEYLHAPVMMGPPAARNATGTMLVSGPKVRFEKVRAELERMTDMVWYLGERPDIAAVFKLCGNAAILSMVGVLADVFHLADAANVDRAEIIRLFDRVNAQGVVSSRGVKMVEGDYSPSFHLEVARKDLRLMQETAGAVPVPMLDALAEHMEVCLAEGRAKDDVAVLARKLA